MTHNIDPQFEQRAHFSPREALAMGMLYTALAFGVSAEVARAADTPVSNPSALAAAESGVDVMPILQAGRQHAIDMHPGFVFQGLNDAQLETQLGYTLEHTGTDKVKSVSAHRSGHKLSLSASVVNERISPPVAVLDNPNDMNDEFGVTARENIDTDLTFEKNMLVRLYRRLRGSHGKPRPYGQAEEIPQTDDITSASMAQYTEDGGSDGNRKTVRTTMTLPKSLTTHQIAHGKYEFYVGIDQIHKDRDAIRGSIDPSGKLEGGELDLFKLHTNGVHISTNRTYKKGEILNYKHRV